MSVRRSLDEVYAARGDTDTDQFRAGYEEARRAHEFATLARSLRKAAGLTQKELARRMGTTASAVARLEAGGSSPTFGTLERLAAGTGVELRLAVAGHDEVPTVRFGAA